MILWCKVLFASSAIYVFWTKIEILDKRKKEISRWRNNNLLYLPKIVEVLNN